MVPSPNVAQFLLPTSAVMKHLMATEAWPTEHFGTTYFCLASLLFPCQYEHALVLCVVVGRQVKPFHASELVNYYLASSTVLKRDS